MNEALLLLELNPTGPLTPWILITFAVTAFVVGMPLLIGLLNYRRASREGQQKDVAVLVGPIIAALIKAHNEEPYAHPVVLARYPTMDQFNAALNAMRTETRAEFESLRTLIASNETRRREDVQTFRDDFDKLKTNVSRAIGGRRGESGD